MLDLAFWYLARIEDASYTTPLAVAAAAVKRSLFAQVACVANTLSVCKNERRGTSARAHTHTQMSRRYARAAIRQASIPRSSDTNALWHRAHETMQLHDHSGRLHEAGEDAPKKSVVWSYPLLGGVPAQYSQGLPLMNHPSSDGGGSSGSSGGGASLSDADLSSRRTMLRELFKHGDDSVILSVLFKSIPFGQFIAMQQNYETFVNVAK